MKKVLSFVAASAFVFAMSSCSKSGTCTCEVFGISSSVEYTDLDNDEYDAAKSACESVSTCSWADN